MEEVAAVPFRALHVPPTSAVAIVVAIASGGDADTKSWEAPDPLLWVVDDAVLRSCHHYHDCHHVTAKKHIVTANEVL